MLDAEILEQLKSVFLPLESPVDLVYFESKHEDQTQLVEMLKSLSTTNEKIRVRAHNETCDSPSFFIERNGKPNGISFKGIPGGHEFSSLILAILNSDQKGKFPDLILQNRIKQLKGPINLKTFVSLTCENCPDVVQMLNQMTLIHGNFKHEMIDGAYTQSEVTRLGIQGVPSIISQDQLIHSGRISLIDLLSKLEEHFGKDVSTSKEDLNLDLGNFDVAIIGGGPAGVSAAIYTARKGLKTAIIAEKIGGQVLDTKGIENLISVIYTEGPQLAQQLLSHLKSYPVNILEHRRVKKVESLDELKSIHFESNEVLKAKAVIISTGAQWRKLGVPGEIEYLGRGVAYCPHCDGPFYKGKSVAVIGGGNSGVEAAIDLAGVVKDVVLVEFQDQLRADAVLVEKLKSLPNTSIITSAKVSEIQGDTQKVNALNYEDRKTLEKKKISLDGVFVQIGLLPNSEFIKTEVELNRNGEIIIDEKGRTSHKGIYAAGDVTSTPYKQIIIAMGEGAKVALTVFEDLMLRK